MREFFFFCVTTRQAWAAERPVTDRPVGTTRADNGLRAGLHDRRRAAAVRPPPVVDEPPAGFGVSAAVWPPASESLLSGNRDFDRNAGSAAAPGTSGRILCASTRARRAVARWWNASARWYACNVPREVLLPQGPPGRLVESLPGISISCLGFWNSRLPSTACAVPFSNKPVAASPATAIPAGEKILAAARNPGKGEGDRERYHPDLSRTPAREGDSSAGSKPKWGEVHPGKQTLRYTSLRVSNSLLLRLSKTLAPGITDRAIDHLDRMKNLRQLNVAWTSMTPDAVNAFKERRPECNVSVSP